MCTHNPWTPPASSCDWGYFTAPSHFQGTPNKQLKILVALPTKPSLPPISQKLLRVGIGGHAQLASQALSLLFVQPEEVAQEAAEEPLIEPLMEPEGESYEEQPQVRGGALGILSWGGRFLAG